MISEYNRREEQSKNSNNSKWKDFLQRLGPDSAIKPVKLPHQQKKLVLDEALFNQNPNVYVNGILNETNQEGEQHADTIADRYRVGLQLLNNNDYTNVTSLAYWKASSCKTGNPITNAIDDSFENYWQSDGIQPHTVDAYFSKRMDIVLIGIFFTITADESYTPRVIHIFAGNSPSDAVFYKTLIVNNMNGWAVLTFEDNLPVEKLLKCQYLRFKFPVNHENGKDTHLRGIRVYTASNNQCKPQLETIKLQPVLPELDSFGLR